MLKKIMCLGLSIVTILGSFTVAHASDTVTPEYDINPLVPSGLVYEYNVEPPSEDAVMVRQQIIQKDMYTEIYITEYVDSDGNITIDEMIVKHDQNPLLRSKSGSDTVTRSKISTTSTGEQRWKITITASFSWDDGKSKCTSMSASKSMASYMTCRDFNTSKGDSSLGGLTKAYAKVDYYFYVTSAAGSYNSGKFEITCTTTGTIKDNA